MIRKNLLKATIITTVIATILTTTACGKKTAGSNTADNTKPQVTVSTETKSVAAKELVTFNYTDENGGVHIMEGKIVADENGIATIQAENTDGSIVEFKGNIITDEKGEVTVKDVVAKSDDTFVKEDSTDVIADAGTDNTVTDESGNEGNNEEVKAETPNDSNEEAAPSEPEYTPSEPTPEPEPEAPADSEPSAEPEQPVEPEPTPEPTPAPSMTDEERLVATGHWTYDESYTRTKDGETYEVNCYSYKDSITGYVLFLTCSKGEINAVTANSRDEYDAVVKAHNLYGLGLSAAEVAIRL